MFSPDYIAGLIDADGSIGVYFNTQSHSLNVIVQLTNTCLSLLQELKAQHGGSIHLSGTSKQKGDRNWKDCYVWQLRRKASLPFLKDIVDSLYIKKPQAVNAIEALLHKGNTDYRGGRRKGVPPSVVEYRTRLVNLSSTLNKVGIR